jgi:hypothetical protein
MLDPIPPRPTTELGTLEGWKFDVAFGIAGATDYVSRGITNSGNKPAIQGYIEPFWGPLYANVWASSPDYGELYVKADYNVEKLFTIAGRLFFAPDFNQSGKTATFIAGGVKVPLPRDFAVYGGIGYQFFEDPRAFEQLAWTAGVNYSWKSLTFDLRYWDTNLGRNACAVRSGFGDGCDTRVVFTVSLNSTLSALKDLTQ